ncbi:MAG: hypothetical protein ACTTH7_06625, partial [Treponema sp.]
MARLRKMNVHIFMLFLLVSVFLSCKSVPETVEEPVTVEEPIIVEEPAPPEKSEAEKNAENLFNEITKIRMQVVEVKGDTQFPELFQAADSTATIAKNAYSEKNFSDAEKHAQNALMQYRTLLNLVQIAALKAKINTYDLQDYDADNYRKAEELAAQVIALYAEDPENAYRISQEALQCYESVSNAGFSTLMKDAKQKAEEAKERCDSVKAAASMTESYTQEVMRCRKAALAAENKKYEYAYNEYIMAAKEFNTIYETVKIKRAAALEAMEKAKAWQEASRKLAENADKEAPLPENAEGFSNEPIEVAPIQRLNEQKTVESVPAEPAPTEAAPVPADTPDAEPAPTAAAPAPADTPDAEPAPTEAAPAPADTPDAEPVPTEAAPAPADTPDAEPAPTEA